MTQRLMQAGWVRFMLGHVLTAHNDIKMLRESFPLQNGFNPVAVFCRNNAEGKPGIAQGHDHLRGRLIQHSVIGHDAVGVLDKQARELGPGVGILVPGEKGQGFGQGKADRFAHAAFGCGRQVHLL